MRRIMKMTFGMALVVAMMLGVTSIAMAAPTSASMQIGGQIRNTASAPTPTPAQCHVIYDANGGTGSYTAPDINAGDTDTVLSPADTGISRDGYTFTVWNTRADGSGTDYAPGDSITLNGDATLYAQWTKDAVVKPVSNTTTNTTITNTTVKTTTNVAKTGDAGNIGLWSGMLIVSLGGMVALLWSRRKRQNELQES